MMDTDLLMASFFFGVIGTGFFMYGKKSGNLVALLAGVGLMVVPYFIPGLLAMVTVCVILCAVPAVVKPT